MTMIKKIAMTLFALLPMMTIAQDIIYDKSDSIVIEKILKKHSAKKYGNKGELTLAIAQEFIGKKYVAGTLENGAAEPLFISCEKFDCSTFVELVTAISLTASQHGDSFYDVCKNLEKLRYREGARNGYLSRLHYISWWIADNTAKGIIDDVTGHTEHESRKQILDFMSTHPDGYPLLKGDSAMQEQIAALEKPFCGTEVLYIAKAILNRGKEMLDIRNGDIIALVTTIKGLDTSHVGFAYWNDGRLHLLHASSDKGKVIKDTTTLFNYQKNKSKQIGIKVIRVR